MDPSSENGCLKQVLKGGFFARFASINFHPGLNKNAYLTIFIYEKMFIIQFLIII